LNNQSTNTVDTSTLQEGVYLLELISNTGIQTEKIIINH
jgi:hypothetical protein